MKRTNFMMLATILATVMTTACNNEEVIQEQPTENAHVKLVCGMQVETRAALTANSKTMTDLYILDYDKATGKLLQVLHQTSTATDFAEPDLTLDYGDHTLKVVATRSQEPTLWDAGNITWPIEPNILTPITSSQPVALTATKTSDTFGAEKDVSVGVGTATVNIALDRLVAKLSVNSTDVFPDDCTTITIDFQEYKALSWATMDVIEAVGNQRISDVQHLRGTTDNTLSYFLLVPKSGYNTDITFTMNSTDAPYATITVPDVPFERNKITTITGSLYSHQQRMTMTVNDEWNSETNDITI